MLKKWDECLKGWKHSLEAHPRCPSFVKQESCAGSAGREVVLCNLDPKSPWSWFSWALGYKLGLCVCVCWVQLRQLIVFVLVGVYVFIWQNFFLFFLVWVFYIGSLVHQGLKFFHWDCTWLLLTISVILAPPRNRATQAFHNWLMLHSVCFAADAFIPSPWHSGGSSRFSECWTG